MRLGYKLSTGCELEHICSALLIHTTRNLCTTHIYEVGVTRVNFFRDGIATTMWLTCMCGATTIRKVFVTRINSFLHQMHVKTLLALGMCTTGDVRTGKVQWYKSNKRR